MLVLCLPTIKVSGFVWELNGNEVYLLILVAATNVAVNSWKPNLSKIGCVIISSFPNCRGKGATLFVQGEGLEGMFDNIRKSSVVELELFYRVLQTKSGEDWGIWYTKCTNSIPNSDGLHLNGCAVWINDSCEFFLQLSVFVVLRKQEHTCTRRSLYSGILFGPVGLLGKGSVGNIS